MSGSGPEAQGDEATRATPPRDPTRAIASRATSPSSSSSPLSSSYSSSLSASLAQRRYEVGHPARVGRIEARVAAHPGLILGGNHLHGVALNDCTEQAEMIAARVAVGG